MAVAHNVLEETLVSWSYFRVLQPKAEPYTSEITTKDREKAERLLIEDAQRKLKNDMNAGKYIKLYPRYEDVTL